MNTRQAPCVPLRVCFFGPTGSGKSTLAEHLTRRYDAELIKVAEPLYRLQDTFYQMLGVPRHGQDGELLQFLAQKIEREQAGWLGRTMLDKVRSSANPIVINDDCRWNSYPELERAGFVFVRVRTSPEQMRGRLRQDHTPVRADHAVERGFERFRTDHVLDNDGPLEATLKAAEHLMDSLLRARPSVDVVPDGARTR